MKSILSRCRQAERESLVGPKNKYRVYTSVNAGDPVTKRIHAGKLGVSVSHALQGRLTSLESVELGLAFRSADFDHEFLGVLTLFQHGFDGFGCFSHYQQIL